MLIGSHLLSAFSHEEQLSMERMQQVKELAKLKFCLPDEIVALEHVLELFDEMLMSFDDTVIWVAINNKLTVLDNLLKKNQCDLSDAIVGAASCGHLEMVTRLLCYLRGKRSDSQCSGFGDSGGEDITVSQLDVRLRRLQRILYDYILPTLQMPRLSQMTATSKVHLLVDSGRYDDVPLEMYGTIWKIIDEAAANGHLGVVAFAVGFASGWDFIDSYCASTNLDALSRAVSGGHDNVVLFLLQMSSPQWDMQSALVAALKGKSPKIIEWMHVFVGDEELLLMALVLGARIIRATFDTAAKNSCLKLIEYLVDDNRMSSKVIRKVFIRSALNGKTELVETIYSQNRIPSALTFEALIHAIKRDYLKLVEFFFFKATISDSMKEGAFLKAVQFNKMHTVHLMCTRSIWPREILSEALEVTRNRPIKKFLRRELAKETSATVATIMIWRF